MCSSCGGFPLEVLGTALSTLSFVAVADFELLDTAGLAPLSFVAVLTQRCPLSLLFNTHARERYDAPAAVSTPFSVAA